MHVPIYKNRTIFFINRSHYKPGALKKNNFLESYLTEDTFQNFILKSVLGFIGKKKKIKFS